VRRIKSLGVVLGAVVLALAMAGCGLNPKAEPTPDGFDPPYNYY